MKKVRQWCGYGAALLIVSGCYVEPTREEEQEALKKKRAPSESHASLDDVSNCRLTLSKGCYDGHVAAKTAFHIDGKQFFNADDLATRFKELIKVQDDGRQLGEGPGGYDLKLLTALDNSSFLQGFSYDLTGPLARSGNVRGDGNFGIDELPEGNYDLRVQKSVKFTLVAKQAAPDTPVPPPAPTARTANTPAATPAATRATPPSGLLLVSGDDQTKSKVYCATIYTDATVTIRGGSRQWSNLDDFRLHVTDNQCMNGGNQTILNL